MPASSSTQPLTAPRKAVYGRVSRDPEGLSVSPDAQVEEGLELARTLGWDPATVDTYIDRDLSAWSRKTKRPAWNRIVEGIEDGSIDGLIMHHVDRLLRQVRELEELIDVIDSRGSRFPIHSVHGDLDLSTDSGRAMARILVTMAQHESDSKSRRLKLVFARNAEEGRPHGGGKHPYGWKADRVTLDPAEADLIRMVVDWVLNGVSLSEACRRLNATTPTRSGKPWVPGTLRTILSNPRLAGYRSHHGTLTEGTWASIIDLTTHDRLLELFSGRSHMHYGVDRKWWVLGVLECARCHGGFQSRGVSGVRRYICRKERGGCGQSVKAEEVDAICETVLLGLLEGGHLDDRQGRGHVDDVELAVQRDELAALHTRLEELARDFYVQRSITEVEFRAARDGLSNRVAELEELQVAARKVPHGPLDLVEAWAGATPVERVDIAREVYRTVLIHPATPGAVSFDPTRVELWLHE